MGINRTANTFGFMGSIMITLPMNAGRFFSSDDLTRFMAPTMSGS
ncbi:hypothetical protein UF75_3565 [Desulfosporosinus sp. I2]|nr:hypothetical protein UF75_4232 [Desulfosporosinus sp. I2]KJR46029.1 hypothetical protein UF75_3565 [Desulfosporosinus sp. I2]